VPHASLLRKSVLPFSRDFVSTPSFAVASVLASRAGTALVSRGSLAATPIMPRSAAIILEQWQAPSMSADVFKLPVTRGYRPSRVLRENLW
jgi:hypothetical protein